MSRDTQLVGNINITLRTHPASLVNALQRVCVTFPYTSTHGTGHLTPSTRLSLRLGPSFEARLVDILSTSSFAPYNAFLVPFKLAKAYGAVPLHRLAVLVVLGVGGRLRRLNGRCSVEDFLQLSTQER